MKKRTAMPIRAFAAGACLILLAGDVRAGNDIVSVENSARTLYQCVMKFRKDYGWRINYEDPPFEHPGDLQDFAGGEYKARGGTLLAPRQGSLTFRLQYDPKVSTRVPEPRLTMAEMMRAHEQSGNPGEYECVQQADFWHVVPRGVRKKDGHIERVGSILDTRVSFPAVDRTVGETISLILSQVSEQAHVSIAQGWIPPNFLQTQRANMGANGITARDALILMFMKVNGHELEEGVQPESLLRFAWSLLYNVPGKTYFFNAQHIQLRQGGQGGFYSSPSGSKQ